MALVLVVLLAIAISLIPSLLFTVKTARFKMDAWLSFFIGGAGWLVALLLRFIPVQIPVMLSKEFAASLIYIFYASALAGIFEEPIRFIFYKYVKVTSSTFKNALSFGLGWGFFEAVIMFAFSAIAIIFVKPNSITELFAGAIERNSAVIAHIALSFIVLSCIGRTKLLIIPISLHTILNFFALLYFKALKNIWFVELIIFLFAVSFLLLSLEFKSRLPWLTIKG